MANRLTRPHVGAHHDVPISRRRHPRASALAEIRANRRAPSPSPSPAVMAHAMTDPPIPSLSGRGLPRDVPTRGPGEGAMSHELSTAPFTRRCPYCHGKKTYTKKKQPCCLCHGTGIIPAKSTDLMIYMTLLAALRQLTTPGCDEASTREVFQLAKRDGYAGTFESTAHILASLCRQGFVTKRRFNSETMWSTVQKTGAKQ